MKILAVIPARGGSKGLPRKNVRPFAGKPLICWTIEEALKSKSISRLICSTDDKEIAAVASACGCGVPFVRPVELATDKARTAEVVIHALDQMERSGEKYDAVMCLQPTTPLRTVADIDAAAELFVNKHAESLVSVCEVSESPFWMYKIGDDSRLEGIIKSDFSGTSRQAHPKIYVPNGAIYLIDTGALRHNRTFYEPKPIAYVMDRERSVDIDYELEFRFAEMLAGEIHDRRKR